MTPLLYKISKPSPPWELLHWEKVANARFDVARLERELHKKRIGKFWRKARPDLRKQLAQAKVELAALLLAGE